MNEINSRWEKETKSVGLESFLKRVLFEQFFIVSSETAILGFV